MQRLTLRKSSRNRIGKNQSTAMVYPSQRTRQDLNDFFWTINADLLDFYVPIKTELVQKPFSTPSVDILQNPKFSGRPIIYIYFSITWITFFNIFIFWRQHWKRAPKSPNGKGSSWFLLESNAFSIQKRLNCIFIYRIIVPIDNTIITLAEL